MIGQLEIVKEEIKKGALQVAWAGGLSKIGKGSPWQRPMLLFCKGLKEVGGDESKIHVVYGKIQISFFVGSAMAA